MIRIGLIAAWIGLCGAAVGCGSEAPRSGDDGDLNVDVAPGGDGPMGGVAGQPGPMLNEPPPANPNPGPGPGPAMPPTPPPAIPEPPKELYLGLTEPEQGFQIRTKGVTIGAGEDVEYCEVVQIPGDPSETYYVNRLESGLSEYSHHQIITTARPGSSNEMGMADGRLENCGGAEGLFGQGLDTIMGSSTPYREIRFPAGVGQIYRGGQYVVFNYHYFNVSSAAVEALGALNFHTVDSVERVAHRFGFYDLSIFIPAGQTRSFSHACTFDVDVRVGELHRHTHKWGTDFNVYYEGGPMDGQLIWTSTDWEQNTEFVFPDEGILMPKGTGFRFECNFNNTSDHLLYFGPTATDEMCILFGMWWPDSAAIGDPGSASQDCSKSPMGF